MADLSLTGIDSWRLHYLLSWESSVWLWGWPLCFSVLRYPNLVALASMVVFGGLVCTWQQRC